ncbi:MAG: SPOR domain-containing protein [Burkholderiaceae bacterium]
MAAGAGPTAGSVTGAEAGSVTVAAAATAAAAGTATPSADGAASQELAARVARARAALAADQAAGHYVQLAAYSSFDGAQAGRAMLAREAGWIAPQVHVRLDGGLYKLRAGPYAQREQAIRAAERVRRATGLKPMMMTR